MFIRRARYDTLIRAEATADYLRVRVNQLEHEIATLRYKVTGEPQLAVHFDRDVPAAQTPKTPRQIGGTPFRPPNARPSFAADHTDFEDMGDDAARVEGVDVDSDGRVKL